MGNKQRPTAIFLGASAALLTVAIAFAVPPQHRLLVIAGGLVSGAGGAAGVVLWGRKPSEGTQQSIEKIKAGLLAKAEEETGLDFPALPPYALDAVATELPQAQPSQPQVQPAPFNSFPSTHPESPATPLPTVELNDPWLQQGQESNGKRVQGEDDLSVDLFG